MRILLSLSILIFTFSCNQSTEFYSLNKLSFEHLNKNNQKQIYEYIVIANPPVIQDSLILLLTNYNNTTINFEALNNDNVIFYQRSFYKETRDTPRDYEEDHSFISNIIADHIDDLIAVVKKDKNDNWTLKLKIQNNPDKWKELKIQMNNKLQCTTGKR
ncbi:hypothetical protein [Plebeiibacterium marinum]|uniref:Lipoprotein n=1 Tax=Plebeiibacterium marinum TaxID=2992111 RepID=A0AAE3SJ08_9BACT|nr:hypothetical protein [Plebeiobacterium marinum]MCW3805207.1 hypothetical protein [Plebeiobacterium marinum]